MKRGRAGTVTHDDERHGTTTLFAALNTLDGSAISTCQPRQRHGIWLKFLKLIDGRTPKHLSLHLIADNYATHRHHDVRNWLARHPRFIMHFTPTGASWSNMVERFFRDITDRRTDAQTPQLDQRRRTGTRHRSVRGTSQHRSQAIHLDRQRIRHLGQGDAGESLAPRLCRISTQQSGAEHERGSQSVNSPVSRSCTRVSL